MNRILAALLVLLLLASLLPVSYAMEGAAGNPDGLDDLIFSTLVVNPCYSEVIREEDIPKASESPADMHRELLETIEVFSQMEGKHGGYEAKSAAPTVYENTEAAGAALKRGLLQRQADIRVRLKSSLAPSAGNWESLCAKTFETAVRHSGAPEEGDYLRYACGGYHCVGSAAALNESGLYLYSFLYSPLCFTSLQQETELNARIEDILNRLILPGMSDEQKIRAVYGYLCDQVRFEDSGGPLRFTAYDALVKGKAACQGVAAAFYRLCLELGLDTRVVFSRSLSQAWNIVRADGRHYYALDAAWDAGKSRADWQYYLKGRVSWQEKRALGDPFENGAFADYLFPDEDYGKGTDVLIHSVSLLFDGLLSIKYYFILPEGLKESAGAFVQFSRNGTEIARVPLAEGKAEGECSSFYCSVNASEIALPVQARILAEDGTYLPIQDESGTSYPNGFFFSPMEYAEKMQSSAASPEMKELARALEDYGTAAQAYFNNEAGELRDEVRAVQPDDLKSWTTRIEGEKPRGFAGASISVLFETDNSIRLYLSFDADSEKRLVYTIDGQETQPSSTEEGVLYLSVEGIAPDALDTEHRFTISDGEQSYSVTTSVLAYARTVMERGEENLANLARALYLYNRAAEAYFGRKNSF